LGPERLRYSHKNRRPRTNEEPGYGHGV
jgi:hypothetical protein